MCKNTIDVRLEYPAKMTVDREKFRIGRASHDIITIVVGPMTIRVQVAPNEFKRFAPVSEPPCDEVL